MRPRVPALITALFLLAALPGTAGARGGDALRSEHDRILAYWTPARIANAKPRDYVMTASGSLIPAAKPPGTPGGGPGGGGGGDGGGGGGSVPTVTGASWNDGGAIEERSGRVLFSDNDGNWICSASVVSDGSTSNGFSLVVSAGHCAYNGSGGFASNWMYMPDFDAYPSYNCATRPLGCWTATDLFLWTAFVSGGGFGGGTLSYDWSIARVGLGGSSGNTELDSLAGGYSLKTSGNGVSDAAWAFGYPAAQKYKGYDLVYCAGTTVSDPYGRPTWGLGCDMTGGSSGGPWLVDTVDPAGGSGSIASVNSYGYTGLKYMFGPIFNANTQATYNAARTLTPTAGVTRH